MTENRVVELCMGKWKAELQLYTLLIYKDTKRAFRLCDPLYFYLYNIEIHDHYTTSYKSSYPRSTAV
jgi:hypothetical protein